MARYWFRQKRFGYGATPNTWQGWLFTLVGVALIFGIVFGADRYVTDVTTQEEVIIGGMIIVLVPFCWISYVKTEGGWRWRS